MLIQNYLKIPKEKNMRYSKRLLFAAAVLVLSPPTANSAGIPEDHAEIAGPFESPMEVTAACLECHENASMEVMATSHWSWELEQKSVGKGTIKRGKKNVINNYSISLAGNEPRCTSCHVGYGWKDANFDFTDPLRVDCLACHDTTGTYDKGKDAPTGAGMPPGFTGDKEIDKKPYDLVKMAQNAGKPTRTVCLTCHAYGNGGNNTKHGDLSRALMMPAPEIDVHMSPDSNDLSCQDCHVTSEHKIQGNALMVSPLGEAAVKCVDCHDGDPHENVKMRELLAKHFKRVSCQACHIPFMAKNYATNLSWDWSKALDPKTLAFGRGVHQENGFTVKRDHTTHKEKMVHIYEKGNLLFKRKVMPIYTWYNGQAEFYVKGEKILDPDKETRLVYPTGSRFTVGAKIYPFKVHRSKQPYDKQLMTLITPKTWGPEGDPDAYYQNFDWVKASAAGMKASGLEFSGEVGFAKTVAYNGINHMVSPAKDGVKCRGCHGYEGRLDWKALGYDGDPKSEVMKKK